MAKSAHLNDNCWVKLTPLCEKILYARHADLRKSHPSIGTYNLRLTDKGYYSCQFWSLMEIFGPHIRLGMIEQPFAPIEVYFEEPEA